MKVIQVYLPGPCEPITLDDYATYLALVAGCSSEWGAEYHQLPDEVYYDNPKMGSSLSISPPGEDR